MGKLKKSEVKELAELDAEFGGDVGVKRVMDVLDDAPLSLLQKRYLVALCSGKKKKECYELVTGKTYTRINPYLTVEADPAFREYLPIVQRAYLGESLKRLGDAGRLAEKLEDVRRRAREKDDFSAELKALDTTAKVAGVYGGVQDNGDGYMKLIKSLTVNNVQVNISQPAENVDDAEVV